jgi:hypothetical protein
MFWETRAQWVQTRMGVRVDDDGRASRVDMLESSRVL